MTTVSIQDLMNLLPRYFIPEQAKGIAARIGFDLSGEGGGYWTVVIENQTCRIVKEKIEPLDLTLSGEADVVLDIFRGRLDAMRAYLMGKIKMAGNMSLAMQLTGLFKPDKDELRALGGKVDESV
ncbi:MAG: SCP2 sterol-binding domain-containing protein [Chloroflexota bacterium]